MLAELKSTSPTAGKLKSNIHPHHATTTPLLLPQQRLTQNKNLQKKKRKVMSKASCDEENFAEVWLEDNGDLLTSRRPCYIVHYAPHTRGIPSPQTPNPSSSSHLVLVPVLLINHPPQRLRTPPQLPLLPLTQLHIHRPKTPHISIPSLLTFPPSPFAKTHLTTPSLPSTPGILKHTPSSPCQ